MVTLKDGCARAIHDFLTEHGIPGAIRIDLRFSGCCDPSLGLVADTPRESDRIWEVEGLVFLVSPEVYETAGDVTIDYVDDGARKGFIVSSRIPVSEWQGFAPCGIDRK